MELDNLILFYHLFQMEMREYEHKKDATPTSGVK
jgi:hypothetical protein